MKPETSTCRDCGATFDQLPGGGRPRLLCPSCTPSRNRARDTRIAEKNAAHDRVEAFGGKAPPKQGTGSSSTPEVSRPMKAALLAATLKVADEDAMKAALLAGVEVADEDDAEALAAEARADWADLVEGGRSSLEALLASQLRVQVLQGMVRAASVPPHLAASALKATAQSLETIQSIGATDFSQDVKVTLLFDGVDGEPYDVPTPKHAPTAPRTKTK